MEYGVHRSLVQAADTRSVAPAAALVQSAVLGCVQSFQENPVVVVQSTPRASFGARIVIDNMVLARDAIDQESLGS